MAYDYQCLAVWSPNMATAIMAINKTETFHILQHIVPDASQGGYWLMFKSDNEVRKLWLAAFRGATILPRDDEQAAPEKQASDAPVWYSAEEANAWANGYNAAINGKEKR